MNENSIGWPAIEQILTIAKEGDMSVAKSLWSWLSDEFKALVLKFVISIRESDSQAIASCPNVRMSSRYGEFTMSSEKLVELQRYIPEVM